MFVPEIKILDCTIRDGGLMNNWQFSEEMVRSVFQALDEAGVDIMEIGYLSSEKAFSRKENGPWKFCSSKDLDRVVEETESGMKLGAIADIGRIEYEDIPMKADSHLDIIRAACYVKDVDKAIDLAHHCIDKGYEACVQLMAVSKVIERDLDEALNDLSKSRVESVYIVDSYGSLYAKQVRALTEKYVKALPNKVIGFHGHNNQQMAFANSVEALQAGARQVDATLFGIGRAAGNCPLELLVAYLNNPKYDLHPIVRAIQDEVLPFKKDLEWGYHMPYMITGALNEHPRSAMKLMNSENNEQFLDFYESLTNAETLE